jgi:hypothetical protein
MAAKKKKSTTRSDTSLESLDLYTFFLDRASDSEDLYIALTAKGARVERHRIHYEDDEPDEVWLPEVCANRWVVISQNQYRNRKGGYQKRQWESVLKCPRR